MSIRIKIIVKIIAKAKVAKVVASLALERGIFLLKITKSFLPVSIESTESISTEKVVVFIPPPVEPGEAPININKTVNKTEDELYKPISIVLKPAVLAVTD